MRNRAGLPQARGFLRPAFLGGDFNLVFFFLSGEPPLGTFGRFFGVVFLSETVGFLGRLGSFFGTDGGSSDFDSLFALFFAAV